MLEVCWLIITWASWMLLEASFWCCFLVYSTRESMIRLRSSEEAIVQVGSTVDWTALGINIHRNITKMVTFSTTRLLSIYQTTNTFKSNQIKEVSK